MGTKNNPGKFDCYEKAERDEPLFVLLGRDPAAPATVLFWLTVRRHIRPGEDEKNEEAMACALALEDWARSLGKGKDVEAALWAMAASITELARDAAVKEEREACAKALERLGIQDGADAVRGRE